MIFPGWPSLVRELGERVDDIAASCFANQFDSGFLKDIGVGAELNYNRIKKPSLTEAKISRPDGNTDKQAWVEQLCSLTSYAPSQAKVVFDITTKKIVLAQGPPGTGKSFMVLTQREADDSRGIAALVGVSNDGVDNSANTFSEVDEGKVIRLGSQSKTDSEKFGRGLLRRADTSVTPYHQQDAVKANSSGRTSLLKICKDRIPGLKGEVSYEVIAPAMKRQDRKIWDHFQAHGSWLNTQQQSIDAPTRNRIKKAFTEVARVAFDQWRLGKDYETILKIVDGFFTKPANGNTDDTRPLKPNDKIQQVLNNYWKSQNFRDDIWAWSPQTRNAKIAIWHAATDHRLQLEETVELMLRLHRRNERQVILSARYDAESFVRKGKLVVACTASYAAMGFELLKQLRIKILSIDEAALIDPASMLLLSALPDLSQIVCVGDHQQMQVSVNEEWLKDAPWDMNQSYFEAAFNASRSKNVLLLQGRMHPMLSELHQKLDIYSAMESAPRTQDFPRTAGVNNRLLWVDHRSDETEVGSNFASVEHASRLSAIVLKDTEKAICNPREGQLVARIVRLLLSKGSLPEDITILTCYQGQVAYLADHMRNQENYAVWINEHTRKELLAEGKIKDDELAVLIPNAR